ncbi:MAG: DUF4399 domain-containing protein [Gammaproteobacteria bacterium]|nr:DUF4399 domain-containing protein [Gammaproteobacteria bacterium]
MNISLSRFVLSKYRISAALLSIALLLSACGRDSTETSSDEAPPSAARDDAAPIAALPRTVSPAGASVFFVAPADGDTVSNPVMIEFGVEGMTIVKAGEDQPQSGHHHLLIDTALPDLSLPIPADENYVHFGDASLSTERTLEPGTHTLQLLLGDHLHIPHDPPVTSEVITIIVE